jgi:hypothetical protein
MDRRPADEGLPQTTPLEPKLLGRGLPVPPVAVVAIVSLFIGLALGYGVAPKPSPALTTSGGTASPVRPLPSAVASVTPTRQPIPSPYEPPPAGGLTVTEALEALAAEDGFRVPLSAVISARIARYGEVDPAHGFPKDAWVWAIVIRGSMLDWNCGNCPSRDTTYITTEMLVLDYETGEWLGGWGPAFP